MAFAGDHQIIITVENRQSNWYAHEKYDSCRRIAGDLKGYFIPLIVAKE